MANIVCQCGKLLEIMIQTTETSQVITFYDEKGRELDSCPRCSRSVDELKKKVDGIQELANRWGPGSAKSKIE